MKPVKLIRICMVVACAAIVVACSTTEQKPPTVIPSTDTGRVEGNDSAPVIPDDIQLAPDAQPQPVKRTRAGNKSPYTVLGKTYTLLPDSQGYQERGYASWYGTKFHGRKTANGEVYDMWAMTAAHKTLPIPSYVRVTNVTNGKSIVVKVNDRGPFHSQRIIDLSYGAALKLGFADKGVTQVDVVDVTPMSASPSTSNNTVSSTVVTVPAKPSEIVTVAPTLAVGEYYQVGAFQQQDNAKKLQQKLASVLNTPVHVTPNAAGTWHRVRIGPIENTQAHAEIRQILFEQGISNPKLIKVP